MMTAVKIGLVGDRSGDVRAHVAIPLAVQLATHGSQVELCWLPTPSLVNCSDSDLNSFAGFWVVPGSPYESMPGALRAIRFARERGRAFLGTCGGFQHALIEYARHVMGLPEADHAESTPDAPFALIERLACSLVGTRGGIVFSEGSLLSQIYGARQATEAYHCSYGLASHHADVFAGSSLRLTGVDDDGNVRALELTDHAFFVGTLFQPELSAFDGRAHPLVTAFIRAVLAS